MTLLARRTAIVVFLAFAFAYFFSALLRAITATLSPTLTREFALNARELGLLAGGYFFGFAATQLPLGNLAGPLGPEARDPQFPAGRGRRLRGVFAGNQLHRAAGRRACSAARA